MTVINTGDDFSAFNFPMLDLNNRSFIDENWRPVPIVQTPSIIDPPIKNDVMFSDTGVGSFLNSSFGQSLVNFGLNQASNALAPRPQAMAVAQQAPFGQQAGNVQSQPFNASNAAFGATPTSSTTTQPSSMNKYLYIGIGVIVLIFGFLFLKKRKR
jgi:LPXTG-motif cell wall-anchored protein